MACLPSMESVTFYELYESPRHFEGWRDVFFHVLSLRVRRWMWVHGGDLCKFGGANNKACEDLEFYDMKTLRRRLVEMLKHLRKCQGTPNHHEIRKPKYLLHRIECENPYQEILIMQTSQETLENEHCCAIARVV